jgi:outer membrane protein OmpA-like peptidoglycan-associated protein
MKCNWRRWLWGIIPLLVLSWVAVQAEHGRLERDLVARTSTALAQSGMLWAMAEFNGRDAILTGRAPEEDEPGKAAETLAVVWGVRTIDNRAGLLDRAETFWWAASRRNNRIRLTGLAPSISARQAILGVTKATFPGFEVVDRTTLARGVPSTDLWMAGVSFGLKQLTSIKRGHVRMQDLELAVAGEADDIAGYRAVKQALANGVPKGVKVTSAEVTAPPVSPFTWAAEIVQGRLVLSGYVSNDGLRADMLATAKQSLPSATIVDQMEPAEGATLGWADGALASLRELSQLEGGSAQIKDAALIVLGTAEDAAAADAIRARLRAAIPATIKLTEQIKVKEPTPPPPPASPSVASADPAQDRVEATTASQTQPAPALPAEAPAPAPPAEVIARAEACEEQLAGVAQAGVIHFRYASAELESASFPTLDQLAAVAKSCPGMHIGVAGHASAEGSADANQALSLKRAQSVVTYLVQAGVDPGRLEPIGFGATRPVTPNDRAKNRRIEFTVRPQ